MPPLTYRHEYKHVINLLDYYGLCARMRTVAQRDPHAGPDGRYRVRSLYFDNDQDTALREKLYGLPKREKFRIRYYNADHSFIRLEKKSKTYGLCNKRSCQLTREQCESIIAGDLAWLSRAPEPLLLEFYGKIQSQRLKPRTIVEYWREAFVYPYGNVRVNLDGDIRSGLYSTQFFTPDLPTVKANEPDSFLLEVKYDQYLPDLIRDVVQTDNRRTASFSKYAISRIYG